jgi:hypothetical protein
MLMPFFTVTVVFEDRTFAIEQLEADTAEHALEAACQQAEALAEHDAAAVADMLRHHSQLFQVAKLRGVWNWFQVPQQSDATSDIYGGIIVQTDPHAPTREQPRESI